MTAAPHWRVQASSKLANDLVSLDTRGEPRLRRNVRAPFVHV